MSKANSAPPFAPRNKRCHLGRSASARLHKIWPRNSRNVCCQSQPSTSGTLSSRDTVSNHLPPRRHRSPCPIAAASPLSAIALPCRAPDLGRAGVPAALIRGVKEATAPAGPLLWHALSLPIGRGKGASGNEEPPARLGLDLTAPGHGMVCSVASGANIVG